MITLLTGAPGTGKTRFLMQRIREDVEKGREVLYITRPQSTHEMERRLIRDVFKDGFMQVQVLDLDRLAQRILDETGGYAQEHMSTLGQVLAVRAVLHDCADQLRVYGKAWQQSGFSSVVAKQLEELESWQVTAEDLENAAESMNEGQLRGKMKDLAVIKRAFDDYCEKRNCSRSNIRAVAARHIDEYPGLSRTILYLDGADNEEPASRALITGLMAHCADTYITVTYDTDYAQEVRFARGRQSYRRYLALFRQYGLVYEIQAMPKDERTGELAFLRDHLYMYPVPRYEQKKQGQIRLFAQADPRREAERVAQQILLHCREDAMRYRDFTVLCANGEEGFRQIQQAFDKYGIQAFYDMRRRLAGSATASLLHRLVQICIKPWDTPTLMNILKSELVDFDFEEACRLENLLLKYGITGIRYWKSAWRRKSLEEMEGVRRRIVKMFDGFTMKMMGNTTTGERVEALFNVLDELGVRERLEDKVVRLQEEGAAQDAAVTAQIWKVLCEIMGQLSHVLQDETFDLREFDAIVTEGILSTELGTIPSTVDQVTVSTLERFNAEHTPFLFITGATEDALMPAEDFSRILHDADIMQIREKTELEIGQDPKEKMDTFKADLYRVRCACYGQLEISYPKQGLGGDAAQNPAHLMEYLRRMFSAEYEKYRTEMPASVYDGFSRWAYAQYLKSRSYSVPEWVDEAGEWFETHEPWQRKKRQVERILGQRETPDAMDPAYVSAMLGTPAGMTVTSLEQYAKCPFSYFMKYVLFAKAREEYEPGALADTGSLIHDILNRLGEDILNGTVDPESMDETHCAEWTKKVFEGYENENAYYMSLASSSSGEAIRGRLQLNAQVAVRNVIRSLNCSDFDLNGVEQDIPKILLQTPQGDALLRGRIDRIDVAKLPEGDMVRIIDYKSTAKSTKFSTIYYGMKLQLAAYLLALTQQPQGTGSESLDPAGMLYFPVGDRNSVRPDQNRMEGIVVKTDDVIRAMDRTRQDGKKSEIIAGFGSRESGGTDKESMQILLQYTQEELKDLAQRILSGEAQVHPAWTKQKNGRGCKYCDYADICGFDERARPLHVNRMPDMKDTKTLEKMCGKQQGGDQNEDA